MQRRIPAPAPRRRSSAAGLGLVEVMVAVAITGVLMAAAVPSFMDLMERRRVTAVAQELAGFLNFARSEANVNGDKISVKFDSDADETVSCAMANVQHGNQEVCKCYLPEATMCGGSSIAILRVFRVENADGVSFAASADTWGPFVNRLGFARNSYDSNVTGFKVTVKGRRTGAQLRVELNSVNRVRTCSPGGSIGGYPVCS